MTNREYMAKQLSDPDFIDDGGASYESMVLYNIACPYFHGDTRSHCKGQIRTTQNMCTECKLEWLEMEVDE